jgi:hypothetical protein
MLTLASREVVLLGLVMGLIVSCSSEPGQKLTPQAASPASRAISKGGGEEYPVIGSLEFRNKIVTILSGPNGPVYTVTTSDGTTVARHLRVDQFQAKFPDLYEHMKNGVAGNDARL